MIRKASLALLLLSGLTVSHQAQAASIPLDKMTLYVIPDYLDDPTLASLQENSTLGRNGLVARPSIAGKAHFHVTTTSIAQPIYPGKLRLEAVDTATVTTSELSCASVVVTGVNGAGGNVISETVTGVAEGSKRAYTVRSYRKVTDLVGTGCLGATSAVFAVTVSHFLALPKALNGSRPTFGMLSFCRDDGSGAITMPRCLNDSQRTNLPYDLTANTVDARGANTSGNSTGVSPGDRLTMSIWGQ